MTITRTQEGYSVVTDTLLSDGTFRADYGMELVGNELRSVIRKGDIRIGGLMRVKLGPKSMATVPHMAVGDVYQQEVR